MKINWKVRLLSVKFWLALVPAILLLAQAVAAPFGYKWDFANLDTQLTTEKKSEKIGLFLLPGVYTFLQTWYIIDMVKEQQKRKGETNMKITFTQETLNDFNILVYPLNIKIAEMNNIDGIWFLSYKNEKNGKVYDEQLGKSFPHSSHKAADFLGASIY